MQKFCTYPVQNTVHLQEKVIMKDSIKDLMNYLDSNVFKEIIKKSRIASYLYPHE